MFISPGLTSPSTRNRGRNSYSTGNQHLLEQESIGGMLFRRDLPDPGGETHQTLNGFSDGITMLAKNFPNWKKIIGVFKHIRSSYTSK
jgi:hypothetical protein